MWLGAIKSVLPIFIGFAVSVIIPRLFAADPRFSSLVSKAVARRAAASDVLPSRPVAIEVNNGRKRGSEGDAKLKTKYPRLKVANRRTNMRVWSSDEVALHNGTDTLRPLLLSCVGEVYDIGPGMRHYAPGRKYHGFAGYDHTRAFSTIDFRESASPGGWLKPSDAKPVYDYRKFYRTHKAYRFVGYLHGRYFGADGKPTAEHARFERLVKGAARVEEVNQQLKARFTACNSRRNQTQNEVWCHDGYHKPGSLPMLLHYVLPAVAPDEEEDAEEEREGSRCVCVLASERMLAEASPVAAAAGSTGVPAGDDANFWFESYEGCSAQRCYLGRAKERSHSS
eukprot:NODE_9320_length_1432_cov_5.457471.p1 GENE.NODE_9320_length_1432_cov_5.457471~~NODE_9320_length_1432_cov_5.457471.p1  ORF type:complete len:339 (-),score=56.49 NODE_9320_length_1432_cov_5.457471:296-1312(-)